MNSLLVQALAVVECARALDARESANVPGLYRLGCEPRNTPRLLHDLAQAIEAFDKAASSSRDPVEILAVAIQYAGQNGVDVRAMAAHIAATLPAQKGAIDLDHGIDLTPQPGEVDAPVTPDHDTVDMAAIRARAPRPEIAAKHVIDERFEPLGPTGNTVLLADAAADLADINELLKPTSADARRIDNAPVHGDRKPRPEPLQGNEAQELMTEVDEIERRLDKAIGIAGASPRLQALKGVLMHMRERFASDNAGAQGVQFRVSPAILLAVLKLSNRVSEAETRLGIEMADDEEPAFRL